MKWVYDKALARAAEFGIQVGGLDWREGLGVDGRAGQGWLRRLDARDGWGGWVGWLSGLAMLWMWMGWLADWVLE